MVARAELEEAIEAALAELPPSQRAALLLLRFEDLSYKEIAQALGITVMAVKSLINRGREGLRRRLARFLGGRRGR
jgi:RNA polymerase sigma-70 factor (ECF subfamily)